MQYIVAINAVLFDLDGTLYDRDELAQKVVNGQYELFRHQLSSVPKDDFIRRLLELDNHGYGDKADLYARVVSEWCLATELIDRFVHSFWSLYEEHCKASDDTRSTLDVLRRKGMKLGVITNGRVEWQQRKLDALGISSCFDTVLISEAEGVQKPDAEIFLRAVSRLGVSASEALFVGDHPEADIGGALSAGMRAVWRVVPYWPCPYDVPSIHRLSQVLPLCLPTG